MRTIIIALLILLVLPLEIVLTLCTLGFYLVFINEFMTSKLIDKL